MIFLKLSDSTKLFFFLILSILSSTQVISVLYRKLISFREHEQNEKIFFVI